MMHEFLAAFLGSVSAGWRRARDAGRALPCLSPAHRDRGVYRFKLGDLQLTALFDGIWYLPIDDKFVRNASGADVNQALAAAFLPPSVLPISFTRAVGEHRKEADFDRRGDRRSGRRHRRQHAR